MLWVIEIYQSAILRNLNLIVSKMKIFKDTKNISKKIIFLKKILELFLSIKILFMKV